MGGICVVCNWSCIAPFFVFDLRDVDLFVSGGLFRMLVVRLCHLVLACSVSALVRAAVVFCPMFSLEAERPAHLFLTDIGVFVIWYPYGPYG